MSEQLFDPKYIYPSDDYGGEFITLTGEVIELGEPLSDSVSVKVKTDNGIFTGYSLTKYAPKIGYTATIKIYNSGGGWYPDNEIMQYRASF